MPLLVREREFSPIWDELSWPFKREGEKPAYGIPADLYESDNEVVVEYVLPGLKPEDVQISLTGDTLTVSAEAKQEETEQKRDYYLKQVRRGSFSQSFTLPADVQADKVDANFENGLLRIILPKAEAAKPKNIQIKVASNS